MTRNKVFIKVSGDLIACDEVMAWLKKLTRPEAKNFTVLLVGGGTQISRSFKEHGIESTFGPLGREIIGFESRQLARDILEQNQRDIQDLLDEHDIHINAVIIPTLDIATVLCHVNGDNYITVAYHGFDKIYVLTTSERAEEKRAELAHLPKVEVVGFDVKLDE